MEKNEQETVQKDGLSMKEDVSIERSAFNKKPGQSRREKKRTDVRFYIHRKHKNNIMQKIRPNSIQT